MTVVSLNNNLAALLAQVNIGNATQNVQNDVQALSSGSRIINAATDVAALSTGIGLQSQVGSINTGLSISAQASSLLQVADGALAQIQTMLQRQQTIASTAQSGSLTDTQRGFLDQEFQSLSAQIDQLAGSTNFNGVKLINGSLSQGITANASTAASASASGSMTLSKNFAVADTVTVNGASIAFVASGATGAQVNLGGTMQQTLANLATFLNGANSNTTLSQTVKDQIAQGSYAVNGTTLTATPSTGGTLGSRITLAASAAAAGTFSISGAGLESTNTITGIGVSDLNTAISTTSPLLTTAGKILNGFVNNASITIYTMTGTDSLNKIVNSINSNTSTTGFRAFVTGSTGNYTLNFVSGDVTSANKGIDLTAASTAYVANGTATATNTTAYLTGGADTGLGMNNSVAIGTVGDNIVAGQNQQSTSYTLTYPTISNGALNSTANFGTSQSITVGGVAFTFTTTASNASATEIQIGSSLSQTLANAAAKINSYASVATGKQAYTFNQIQASTVGTSLVISSRDVGGVYDIAGAAVTVSQGGGLATLSGSFAAPANTSTVNGASSAGFDTSGMLNSALVGNITSGFTATYSGTANQVNLSFTLGGHTYTANNVTTNPSTGVPTNRNADGSETVHLTSTDGSGSFTVTLAANNGLSAGSQTDANTFASRLNTALGGLTFTQTRQVSNYSTASGAIFTNGTVTGSLTGTSVSTSLNNYTKPISISSIAVAAPQGSSVNGSISFTVNGTQFVSSPTIGSALAANTTYQFTSVADPSQTINFKTGSTTIDFSTAANAASFQSALNTALGAGSNSALQFQSGSTSANTISVSIGSATSNSLYGGQTLDVKNLADATTAASVLNTAVNTITALRATVGGLQERFSYATNALQNASQNQAAAVSALLDTDVTSASTAFATAQVQLQGGIAVLAQAQQLSQALVKLL